MAETDPESEFKVTDRRRRAEDTEPAPATSPPERSDRPPVEPESQTAPRASRETAGPGPSREGAAEAREASLEQFFIMLGSSAVVALGEAADPGTGQVRRDPEAATGVIDLLILLREKTAGNRTLAESKLLDELIYDLQLRYVAAKRRS